MLDRRNCSPCFNSFVCACAWLCTPVFVGVMFAGFCASWVRVRVCLSARIACVCVCARVGVCVCACVCEYSDFRYNSGNIRSEASHFSTFFFFLFFQRATMRGPGRSGNDTTPNQLVFFFCFHACWRGWPKETWYCSHEKNNLQSGCLHCSIPILCVVIPISRLHPYQ